MGNDSTMVTNQKVFVRLEKVLELQSALRDVEESMGFHRTNAMKDPTDTKSQDYYALAKNHLEGMRKVVSILELPFKN